MIYIVVPFYSIGKEERILLKGRFFEDRNNCMQNGKFNRLDKSGWIIDEKDKFICLANEAIFVFAIKEISELIEIIEKYKIKIERIKIE